MFQFGECQLLENLGSTWAVGCALSPVVYGDIVLRINTQ